MPRSCADSKRSGFERGGATRRDMRILIVPGVGNEVSRAVIGVSQKKGKVGWRTHFITRGFSDRSGRFHKGRDFLKSAFDLTYGISKGIFAREVLVSFQKWAKRNLPQGKF